MDSRWDEPSVPRKLYAAALTPLFLLVCYSIGAVSTLLDRLHASQAKTYLTQVEQRMRERERRAHNTKDITTHL